MEDSVEDLYQHLIIERARAPHHAGRLVHIDGEAEGNNPMCGDQVHLMFARGDGDVVQEFAHQTHGCAICIASADLLGDVVLGRHLDEITSTVDAFEEMIRTGVRPTRRSEFDKLAAFAGVHAYRSRHRCATLAWQAARTAIIRMMEAHHG